MKKSLITSMYALAGLLGAANAQEVELDESDVEVITISGSFQKSLADALNEKKNAVQVLDAVSAEDIGKLPDISIAESLARLPGIVTNRDRGNATEISIRGLGPNLSTTLLNGREVATGDASRNVRYETYPAELLNGAFVFKSPKASLVEGGVGGTVDLKTVKPLDFGERRVVVNLRGSYFDLASDVDDTEPLGYTTSISYVDQFLGDELGLVLAYTHREQPIATSRTNIFPSTARGEFDNSNTEAFDAAGIERVPYGYEALVRGGDDDRDGVVAALQWEPNESFEMTADFFYSGVDFVEEQRGFRFGFGSIEFGNQFSDLTGGDGSIISGTVSPTAVWGGRVRTVNEEFTLFDDLYAGGINAEWDFDALKVIADFGYSRNDREVQFLTVQTDIHDISSGTPVDFVDGLTGTFSTLPNSPSDFGFNVDLSDPDINLPAFVNVPSSDSIVDEVYNYSLDFEYVSEHDFFTTFDAGVRLSDREKSLFARSDYRSINVSDRTAVPSSLLGEPLTGAGGIEIPATLTFDREGVIDEFFGGIDPVQGNSNTTESWVVKEQTMAAYVNANFEGSIGGIDFLGNVGVRIVKSETESSSTFLENGVDTNFIEVLTPITVENDYTNILPSLNLSFFPTEDHIVRVGLSKAIARAPLDDLAAGVGEFNFGQPAAFGGNPLLDPFETNQLDLTYEWYFAEGSAFTVSGFYKDIETFIVRETAVDATLPSGTTGNFTQPINGKGGKIEGLEVAYTQSLSFLPGWLTDLGLYINYTVVDSDIEVGPAFVEGTYPLPGLAKNALNTQVWYFKNGFEARIGHRYRDEYPVELGDVPDQVLFNDSESVLDFQMSYQFSEESSLEGLKILFQANNLTDEPFRTFYTSELARGRYEEFGKRYWFGFNYEF